MQVDIQEEGENTKYKRVEVQGKTIGKKVLHKWNRL